MERLIKGKDDDIMTTQQERKTITDFIRDNKITSTCTWADSNPNIANSDYIHRHFKVTLRFGRKRLTIPFSQGDAYTEKPTADDVLSCLASDSAGPDDFEEFCAEYGYDSDSRMAERTFKACRKQKEQLSRFLGVALFNELLYETEQL